MLYLAIAIVALGIFAATLGLLSHNKDGGRDVVNNTASSCATCSSGGHRCEQECMMEAATRPIEYFDDEELDAFSGRPPGQYDDGEAEQFREILYTMRPGEVKDWCRSLTLRGIELPDQVKDEVFLMAGDAQQCHGTQ